MKISLGVVDVPYAYEQEILGKKGKPLKKKRKVKKSITTGEIAEILEAKYGIMGVFFDRHGQEIADFVADAYEGALENVLTGGPFNPNPGQEGFEKIDQLFRDFLSNNEMAQLGITGVPTEAAKAGVSHRFAHPYAERPSRPSFIDTGQYQTMFRSWTGEF